MLKIGHALRFLGYIAVQLAGKINVGVRETL